VGGPVHLKKRKKKREKNQKREKVPESEVRWFCIILDFNAVRGEKPEAEKKKRRC